MLFFLFIYFVVFLIVNSKLIKYIELLLYNYNFFSVYFFIFLCKLILGIV